MGMAVTSLFALASGAKREADGLGKGQIKMERFFALAEHDVRVVCVDSLREGWLYVTGSKVLLIDPALGPDDCEDALREVLTEVAAA